MYRAPESMWTSAPFASCDQVWAQMCTDRSMECLKDLLQHSPRRAACQYIEPLACRRPCLTTFSGVPRKALPRLLVLASVRVIGAGRVEQDTNGGCCWV